MRAVNLITFDLIKSEFGTHKGEWMSILKTEPISDYGFSAKGISTFFKIRIR